MNDKEILNIDNKFDYSEKIRKWLSFVISLISILLFIGGILLNFNTRITKIEYCAENSKISIEKIEKKLDVLEEKINQLYYKKDR